MFLKTSLIILLVSIIWPRPKYIITNTINIEIILLSLNQLIILSTLVCDISCKIFIIQPFFRNNLFFIISQYPLPVFIFFITLVTDFNQFDSVLLLKIRRSGLRADLRISIMASRRTMSDKKMSTAFLYLGTGI